MDGLELHSKEMEDDLLEFTLAEIFKMENLYKEAGEELPSQKLCEKLANRFSRSKHRTGKSAIKWEQVQRWFQDKRKHSAAKATLSPPIVKEVVVPKDATITKSAIKSSLFLKDLVPPNARKPKNAIKIPQKPKAERVAGLSELVFEAISSKDMAWYDVAAFLNYRVVYSGELEARVRFAGFGYVEDEWVNVKRGIRKRSNPLEPSECHKVKAGDLVLCYRENDDHALYGDAQIVEVQANIHDADGCTCVFVVRYDYDNAEVNVPLSYICCRAT
ncbi:hypothetical protein LguiA_028702 [Lonicera macranthoides]